MGTGTIRKRLLAAAVLAAFVVVSLLCIRTPKKAPRSEYNSNDLEQVETQNGNVTRYDYMDGEGNLQIAANVGYATRLVTYGDDSELETYLDDQGAPISRYSGYYGILREYDEDGHTVRITYLDEENEPVVMSSGYAIEERAYNESGQQASCRYLDAEGNPTLSSYDGYGKTYEYDDKGCRAKITYLDETGKPMVVSSGYSILVREFYDNDGPDYGRVKKEFYFLPDGTPATLSMGQSGVYKEYNENGKKSWVTYLDADGEPMVTNKGYTSVAYTYNANGSVETTRYFEINGEPFRMNEGHYGTRSENGQTVYLNADGTTQFNARIFAYNDSTFVVVVAIVIVLLSIFVGRKLNWLMLIAYVSVIIYFTLMYRKAGVRGIILLGSYRRLFASAEARADILKNIWLFVPLGAILYRLCPRKTVLLAVVLLSVAIEATQYMMAVGFCELDDVISNGLGAAIGFGMGHMAQAARRQFQRNEC